MALDASQVETLAPDASSLAAGRKLATGRKWSDLGVSSRAVWGLAQGSGKNPYKTQVDLAGPAFKCSCPSRKFPCKHALALLLLHASEAAAFGESEPPGWVAEWLEGRARRDEKKKSAATGPAKAPDPEAKAKREAKRESKIRTGLDQLDQWLRDLIRGGLAAPEVMEYRYWDEQARRMVDAQAPGLARRVRDLGGLSASGTGWEERLLHGLGMVHLLIEAYRRQEDLPEPLKEDVRSLVGWSINQTELAGQPGVLDNWLVVGQTVEEEENLVVKRSWLTGEKSGRDALILHFAHSSQPMDTSLAVGMGFSGELVFFPGAWPLRAIEKSRSAEPVEVTPAAIPARSTLNAIREQFAGALAVNPWIDTLPAILENVTAVSVGDGLALGDATGNVPVSSAFAFRWELLALGGGQPMRLFGEWDGRTFLPRAVLESSRVIPLTHLN